MGLTGHNIYKSNSENIVVSQEQILMKLYDGCLNFLSLAKRGMAESNPKIKGENISKALAIISELDCALDRKMGGDIAENLSSLYQHSMYSLVTANLKNDLETVASVESLLKEIKDGFESAIEENKARQKQYPTEDSKREGMQLAV